MCLAFPHARRYPPLRLGRVFPPSSTGERLRIEDSPFFLQFCTTCSPGGSLYRWLACGVATGIDLVNVEGIPLALLANAGPSACSIVRCRQRRKVLGYGGHSGDSLRCEGEAKRRNRVAPTTTPIGAQRYNIEHWLPSGTIYISRTHEERCRTIHTSSRDALRKGHMKTNNKTDAVMKSNREEQH